MRPYEQWHTLWQFFIVLDEEWADEWPNEEQATLALIHGYSDQSLELALREWHEAFDSADDADVERIVGDFNPGYEPEEQFGGYRQWAEWVREHLEAELAKRRQAESTAT